MNHYLELKIGEVSYKKPNMGILQKLEEVIKYGMLFDAHDVEKISAENRSHLMKVTANGELLDSELKIDKFFSTRSAKEFMTVARWAWIGGLEDFLENLNEY
jgi:hypothetical protein